MICRKCGSNIADYYIYCTECGEPLLGDGRPGAAGHAASHGTDGHAVSVGGAGRDAGLADGADAGHGGREPWQVNSGAHKSEEYTPPRTVFFNAKADKHPVFNWQVISSVLAILYILYQWFYR